MAFEYPTVIGHHWPSQCTIREHRGHRVKKPPRNTPDSSPGSTPAIQTLSQAGVPFTVHTFDADIGGAQVVSGYGLAAAHALGVEHERVFKTVLVELQGSKHGAAVAIVPVTRQVHLKALAATLTAKRAELLDPLTAQRLTGYVIGGISPLGQRRTLPTVIDLSALEWDTIFVSAGRRGADIEMSPRDLAQILKATTAAISDRSWT